ncbi:MAG: glucosaminidase domain-containing protein [Clostridiales bacterium]|nr:glucosaminidase domain-containing protein [Clostridiales bacterium]
MATLSASRQKFITDIAALVQKYAPSYGICVCSPIIAQAILESGWGESTLASKYHNYFGMKCGSKWTGKSVNMTTQEEYTAGTLTTITDNFRVYDSMDEGVKGYFEFIQLSRYSNLKGITDPKKYLETIKADGYATSSSYVTNTYNVVTTYSLTKYDTVSAAVTEDEAIAAVIAVAEAEIGYLEKASNASLDSKTTNAGSANYTKYGRDMHNLLPSVMDFPAAWCDAFVDWCFYKAFGETVAKQLLCGNFDDYTVNSAQYYKNKGQWHTSSPKAGDQVFFKNSSGICHTGLVTKVDSSKIYTIEGNTSSASGVVANGGCVRDKSYALTYSSIAGYGRPDYSIVTEILSDGETEDSSGSTTTSASTGSTASTSTTTSGGSTYMFSVGNVKNGSSGNDVKLLQRLLKSNGCKGADGKALTIDGSAGANTVAAIKTYQKNKGLSVDGCAGPKTWKSILLR